MKRNRKVDVQSVGYTAAPPLPDLPVLKSLKDVCPNAAFFSLIPKLDPEDTDSASEDEDETNLPQPLTALYSQEYISLSPEDMRKKCHEVVHNLVYTKDNREELELVTRNQAVCPLWFEHRKGRITATKAHSVVHRRETTPPENLVKHLKGYDSRDLSINQQLYFNRV